MYFDTFDYFEEKMGANVWPSSDPNDSPFNTFTCKLCGASKDIQMLGGSFIGEPSFEEKARVILRDHLDLCPKFNKIK